MLAVIVGGAFWLGYRFRVSPWWCYSFRSQTEALSFTPREGDPLGLLDQPVHAFPLGRGRLVQIENTATGSHRGREIAIRRLPVRADRG